MNNMDKIDKFARLQRLINLFQRVNQISWSSDQSRKRYPTPEMMTDEEVDSLTRLFLALGLDIKEIYEDWKKEFEEYKKSEK